MRSIELMEELLSFSDASLRAQLGPLELKVLDTVWSLGTATVREVVRHGNLWQTYPTIMTTMDRLFKKGLLTRVLDRRAFRYAPKYTLEELERAEAIGGIERLLGSQNVSLHLSYLVQAVGAQDGRLLDELQDLVERQRAALKKDEP
ncbi:MAG TPA: BlaI/MecI/CopY family transcriptional regulator [Candidatus Sulfotelmatobacter sp.]|nr:BlaI/MecI/CopY family transcriptional regulator [Candidatus Sulfotelmatobacter sp.]